MPNQLIETITKPDQAGLYPDIAPFRSGTLPVSNLHTLYWEESGNPQGAPVLFLHGGPGAGSNPRQRRFFDPQHYRIVLFDQRGAGRSTPLGECRDNTLPLLIDDIEALRQALGIDKWLIFGGSWGSTLALAYGQAHPQRCSGFVLRGVFLCSPAELDWFLYGMRNFFPQAHARFARQVGATPEEDLLAAYYAHVFGPDAQAAALAARAWAQYEAACIQLLPAAAEASGKATADTPAEVARDIALGQLELHYFQNRGFMEEGQLLRDMHRILHLPAFIVQGRYDMVCPPVTAWRLHQAWPGSELCIVPDAGHSAFEPGISRALVAATDRLRSAAPR